jgi:hypothetical protein
MKHDQPSEQYIEKAKLLSKEDAERLFARMRRRYLRWTFKEKLNPLEAVALQLEYEDEQLEEWRDKMNELKDKEI